MSGGVSHEAEGLSNRRGVPGVPGEEICRKSEFVRCQWSVVSGPLRFRLRATRFGRRGWLTAEALVVKTLRCRILKSSCGANGISCKDRVGISMLVAWTKG